MSSWPFAPLEKGKYGAILADPPWNFHGYSDDCPTSDRHPRKFYDVMETDEICGLPVDSLAADNSVLFVWIVWPHLSQALDVINSWGFVYKTCAFTWMKAHANQIELFRDDIDVQVGLGYWTRSNSEVCLLATRGKPKRLNADVRQGIIAPRREHSRKPDGIHERIERLVAGPYVELFARQKRPGWDCWGNETGKFEAAA